MNCYGKNMIDDPIVKEYTNLLCDIYSRSKPENIVVEEGGNIKEVYPESIQILIDTITDDFKSYVENNYGIINE